MSAQYLNSNTPNEDTNIKCNYAVVRSSLNVTGNQVCAGLIDCDQQISAKSFKMDGFAGPFTQITSDSTDVDASSIGVSRLFRVATVSLTLTAGGNAAFNVLMPTGLLTAQSQVLMSIYDYSGSYATEGTPFAYIGSIDPSVNRFKIIVKNIAVSEALLGVLSFNITIIEGAN